eukprot:3257920-Alexandrium_andersonii.AAC.1
MQSTGCQNLFQVVEVNAGVQAFDIEREQHDSPARSWRQPQLRELTLKRIGAGDHVARSFLQWTQKLTKVHSDRRDPAVAQVENWPRLVGNLVDLRTYAKAPHLARIHL